MVSKLVPLVLVGGCFLVTEETRTVKLTEAVTAVEVRTDTGDIRVEPSLDGGITIEQTLRYTAAEPFVEARVEGGVLIVRGNCPGIQAVCATDFVVRVPAGVSLLAESGAGDVASAGITGPLVLSTGSGDIRAEGSAGEVRASTGSGDVALRDILGDVVVESGSGDIELSGLEGAIAADAGSGDITGSGLRGVRLRFSVGSGDIEAALLSAPEELAADTNSGDVAFTLPGGAYQIVTETGSGDVSVEGLLDSEAAPGVISASTGSGDISLVGR